MILFTSMVTPYRIAFVEVDTTSWIVFELILDFIFAVDIALNFFTAYFDSHHNLILDRKLLARKYMTGWFYIDFISIIPLNLMMGSGGADYNSLARIARLPKLYKLIKMFK
jgi:hypothetical protein